MRGWERERVRVREKPGDGRDGRGPVKKSPRLGYARAALIETLDQWSGAFEEK
jgi:hypothetical protein